MNGGGGGGGSLFTIFKVVGSLPRVGGGEIPLRGNFSPDCESLCSFRVSVLALCTAPLCLFLQVRAPHCTAPLCPCGAAPLPPARE